ncbi:MAG: hypothetical protein AAGH89_02680 [Verrucomicrobiota bacterium]
MKTTLLLARTALLLGLLILPTWGEEQERKWRTPEGRFWVGTLLDVDGDRVQLRMPDGSKGNISLSKLGEPDQRYIAKFVADREEAAALGPEQIAKEKALAATLSEGPRSWTSSDGKAIQGQLEDFDGSTVQLRTTRGVFKFPADRLSAMDQRLLRRWVENRPVQVGDWPDFVEAPDDMEIEFVDGGVEGWEFVYRSPHFEFRTTTRLSISVVREFARIFEATFEVVKALPVGFNPQPREGGYFLTELYETRNAYYAAGGPAGSGGVFMGGANKIMIPLPNLGVKQVGNRWILESGADSTTLQHEITHQVTYRWLSQWPVWFIEGLAEYVSSARYNKGRYTLKNMAGNVEDSIMAYPVDGNSFPMVPIETLMTMDHGTWGAALTGGGATYNYRSSNALMFYFLHLDGEGDGSGVATFLHALNQGVPSRTALAEHLVRGRDFAALSEEVDSKLKQSGIRIEYR